MAVLISHTATQENNCTQLPYTVLDSCTMNAPSKTSIKWKEWLEFPNSDGKSCDVTLSSVHQNESTLNHQILQPSVVKTV